MTLKEGHLVCTLRHTSYASLDDAERKVRSFWMDEPSTTQKDHFAILWSMAHPNMLVGIKCPKPLLIKKGVDNYHFRTQLLTKLLHLIEKAKYPD